MTRSAVRARIVAAVGVICGVTVGLVVGAIVAVNIVISVGPDTGYESSVADVFRHSPLVGIAAGAPLLAGPIVGAIVVHRLRLRRNPRSIRSPTGSDRD